MSKVHKDFDPLKDVVTAQHALPKTMKAVNFSTLTPFQRALLVTDGTVTKFIESYTLEPLEVIRTGHKHYQLEANHLWLDAEKGTEVIFREVIIRGISNQRLYVYAASYLVPNRLPKSIRDRLEIQGESIGRLLNDKDMETRREILWYGSENPKHLPNEIADFEKQDFVSRAYRIFTKKKPIMLINEKFPVKSDPLTCVLN